MEEERKNEDREDSKTQQNVIRAQMWTNLWRLEGMWGCVSWREGQLTTHLDHIVMLGAAALKAVGPKSIGPLSQTLGSQCTWCYVAWCPKLPETDPVCGICLVTSEKLLWRRVQGKCNRMLQRNKMCLWYCVSALFDLRSPQGSVCIMFDLEMLSCCMLGKFAFTTGLEGVPRTVYPHVSSSWIKVLYHSAPWRVYTGYMRC